MTKKFFLKLGWLLNFLFLRIWYFNILIIFLILFLSGISIFFICTVKFDSYSLIFAFFISIFAFIKWQESIFRKQKVLFIEKYKEFYKNLIELNSDPKINKNLFFSIETFEKNELSYILLKNSYINLKSLILYLNGHYYNNFLKEWRKFLEQETKSNKNPSLNNLINEYINLSKKGRNFNNYDLLLEILFNKKEEDFLMKNIRFNFIRIFDAEVVEKIMKKNGPNLYRGLN